MSLLLRGTFVMYSFPFVVCTRTSVMNPSFLSLFTCSIPPQYRSDQKRKIVFTHQLDHISFGELCRGFL